MNNRGLPIVLAAEDDPGDRVLLQEAFHATGIPVDLRIVADGEELLAYLSRQPPWNTAELPDLILLDLDMPRVTGFEVLRKIKAPSDWKSIPVVVLTTSTSPEDVAYA